MSVMYDYYLNEHRDNVRKAYVWLKENLAEVIGPFDFIDFIEAHDSSKYEPLEYEAYDNYFYGKNRGSRSVKENFDYAWLNHIHENPHHWQHWVLMNDTDGTYALAMPHPEVIEMICDWWSFSHKTGNLYEIFKWYEKNRSNMILHDVTRKQVEGILEKIKDKLDSMR